MSEIKSFEQLMKADSKVRSKLSKAELLTLIENGAWTFKYNADKKQEAEDALVTQSKNEDAAKAILTGYLGLPATEKNNYGDDVKVDYTLLDLVGKVLASKS